MPIFFFLFIAAMALPVFWPQADLVVSGLFYRLDDGGFFLNDNRVLEALHGLAVNGSRLMGAAFMVLALAALVKRRAFFGIDAKGWLFLLLALVIGPGLVANAGFKDHWGRARPHQIVEFGGAAEFSPALEPHFEKAHSNGSFVCGDGAFGFFLPAFAFVVAPRRARRVFAGTMLAGAVFCFGRVAQGAHFFSDAVYAAAFMLMVTAALHAAMYGGKAMLARWRLFFAR